MIRSVDFDYCKVARTTCIDRARRSIDFKADSMKRLNIQTSCCYRKEAQTDLTCSNNENGAGSLNITKRNICAFFDRNSISAFARFASYQRYPRQWKYLRGTRKKYRKYGIACPARCEASRLQGETQLSFVSMTSIIQCHSLDMHIGEVVAVDIRKRITNEDAWRRAKVKIGIACNV